MKKLLLYFFIIFNKLLKKKFHKKLEKKTYFQFVKYYFVGVIGLILNYLIFNVLKFYDFRTELANAITYVTLIIITFFLHKYFTYKVYNNTILQSILFIINSIFYFILETIILVVLIDKLGIVSLISKMLSIFIMTPLTFLIQKYIVFRKR